MYRFYLSLLLATISLGIFAQRSEYQIHPVFENNPIEVNRNEKQVLLTPTNWDKRSKVVHFKTVDNFSIFGKNELGDQAKGQMYRLERSAIVKGIYISIISNDPNANGYIDLKLWSFDESPKSEVLSQRFQLNQLSDQLSKGWIYLPFEDNIIVSGEILVGINFTGDNSSSLGIVSSSKGDGYNSNIVWEQWADDSWHLVNSLDSWNFDVELAIFPLVEYQAKSVEFAGGSGTKSDPWQVENAEQLDAIRNYTSSHFIQIANIDLNLSPWNQGWIPISLNEERPFTGSYNGGGYEIINLYINLPEADYVGLFSRGIAAEFNSIKLVNTDIIGKDLVGGLIGLSQSGSINNVEVTGIIQGEKYVGGIAGVFRNGIISNSISNISLSGHRNLGGIAGIGETSKCHFQGVITGIDSGNNKSSRIGGLLGEGFAINSATTGTISGGSEIGGLIGVGAAIASSSSGDVFGTGESIGGLIGRLSGDYGELTDYPEYYPGEAAPSDGPLITENIISPGGGPVTVILEDGTRVLIPAHETPLTVTVQKLPLEIDLDAALPGWSGLRVTGSMRRITIEGEGDHEDIKPIITFPTYEAGTINVETINAVRVGNLVVNGELFESRATLIPIIQLEEEGLKFMDAHFPESVIVTESIGGLGLRDTRRFVGEVNYFLITFDQSINWSKKPELIRMIPDTLYKDKSYRRPLKSLDSEQKESISKQPICNVVILVHGHNEEEKDGYIGNRVESPWEFYYKQVIWELFHEEFIKNDALDSAKGCTAIYEFISPTYRPIFSPVGSKTGYYHTTLGEDFGRLVNQEFENNPQLKAMIDADVPFNLLFVAHSQGGLIMRAGLRFIDNKILKHTKRAITWGSPHIGAGLYSLRYALAVGHDIVIDGYKLPMQNLGQSEYYQTYLANKALDAPGILDMRWDASKKDLLRLGELMKENTTTLNEFKDTELPNGRLFFSDNLKLFNENEGKFQLSQLAAKYMFYEARTPKIAELEIEYIYIFIKNLWKFKEGATEVEIGAQANKLTMKPAFSESDGAVPTYSQRGTGIWPEGNIQRRFFEDVDHQEFYGGEKSQRTEAAKAKGRMILQNTYSDLELESRSRSCPWIEISRVPDGDSTLIEGQFYFPIFDVVNGGNGKPGLWISNIQIRKDSLKGEEVQSIKFEIEDDGKFTIKAKTIELPEEDQFIVLILKDESEVFIKAKEDDIKLVFNKDLMKWYRSIQAAVNEASEGHEILVYPGTLRDRVNIDKTLTIRSTQDKEVTIIDGVNFPNSTAFVMNNCSPTIDGFTIKNWRKGIAMGGTNTYPEIKNNIIENNEWGGIQLLGGSAIKLYNNIIRNNEWHAVEIYTPGQGEVNIIEDNEIYNNFNGIIGERVAVLEIKNNNIYNNISGGDAIRLSGENVSATITDNTIQNNEGDGISISDGASAAILRNNIENNSHAGIFVYSNSNETIITDNIISGNRYGISAKRATITNNTITNNRESGIYAESSTIIHDNIITSNTNWGIQSSRFDEYISNITITNNTINLNGGGIHIQNVDDVEIVENEINDNTTLRGVHLAGQRINVFNNQIVNNNGGGIQSSALNVNISNNTISGNTAEYGGGVYLSGQGTSLTNNIISSNFATIKGGGVYGTAAGWQRFETVIVDEMPREVKRHVPCFMENTNSYSGNSHGEVFGEWGPGTNNWCPEAGHDVTID